MPTCDYCCKHYTFGSLKAGSYKFCSGLCRDRGQILAVLDNVPNNQNMQYVIAQQSANCPACGKEGPIDARSPPARFPWADSAIPAELRLLEFCEAASTKGFCSVWNVSHVRFAPEAEVAST
jgi:hypothetical protein